MQTSKDLKRVGECLYRSGNGTYYALVKVLGKQIKRSLRTTDERLARRRLVEFRMKAERLTGNEKSLLFEDLAKRWLQNMEGQLKPSSLRRRQVCINQIMPFLKSKLVRSIGQADIEKWQIARTRKISNRSFNIERETLYLVFDYAIEHLRILLENPVSRIKRRKQAKRKIDIPNRKQFSQMVQFLKETPWCIHAAYLVEFLGYSGLRLGEAICVRWQDVNFEMNNLLVTGGELGTKNHEVRTIPLFPPLKDFLLQLKADRMNPKSSDLIFQTVTARGGLDLACKTLRFPRYGHHSMRHFFCSNAIEAGIDFKVIAEWLGHKDGGVLVAKTYGHLRNEHSRAMAEKMTFKVEV